MPQLSATGVIVSFPGLTIARNNKNGPIEGFSSDVLNDYLIASRLNISMIEAESVGNGCWMSHGNVSCNGVYEKLQTCQGDFSVFPLGMKDYDRDIFQLPTSIGPEVGSAPQMFLAFNRTTGSEASLTFSLPPMDAQTVAGLFLVLLSLFMMALWYRKLNMLRSTVAQLEIDAKKMRRRSHVARKRVNDQRDVQRSKLFDSRIVCFLFATFFFIFNSVVISTSKTNQVIFDPPLYFKNIDEAARATSYKILALKGATALAYFRSQKEKVVHSLLDTDNARYEWFDKLQINDLARKMMEEPEHTIHMSTISVMRTVKALMCNYWFTSEDKAGRIPPWYLKEISYAEGLAMATYSRCIKDDVRSRLDTMFYRLMEADLFNLYSRNTAFRIPVAYEMRNLLCVKDAPPYTVEGQSHDEDDDAPVIGVLIIFFFLPSIGVAISTIFFLVELIFPPRKLKKRPSLSLVKSGSLPRR